jgi:tetratricopeptide (TPR) repeat protein
MDESRRLVEELLADQSRCWRGGRPRPVEDYLRQHPGLRPDADAVLSLIYHEVLLREARGEAPDLDDYLRRFPELSTPLRLQFSVHQGGWPRTVPWDVPSSDTPAGLALPPLVPQVPGYEVRSVLGRGAMGVVYRARQLALGREVALKTIDPAAGDGQDLARFLADAQALAHVQHPNIVQVYEVGQAQGRPFFSMELVDGGSLAALLRGVPQPPRHAAEIVALLARAVHHAHQRGIVHRDLKPQNVLVTTSGVPKVADFGLAKRLDENVGQTQPGTILGTPSYMAPEQAAGQARAVGPAADVYGLGAILYELLTGRPPFAAATVLQTLEQVRSQPPLPPRRLQPRLPRDLETICLKCLEKADKDRYASAEALAEDLQRFLDHRPIHARRSFLWERALKWARRRPAAAALLAVSALAVLGGALFWYEYRRSAEARNRLQIQQEAEAEEEKLRKFRHLRDDAVFLGMNSLAGNDLLTGMDAAASRTAAHQAAGAALQLAGISPEDDRPAPPALGGNDPARRREVVEGCYTLLLLLADGATDADRALKLVERAGGLHAPTQAYRRRRDHFRRQLGLPPESAALVPLPSSAMDHFLIGHEHYKEGQRDEAARCFERALTAQPDHPWAHLYLGRLAMQAEQWQVAGAHFNVLLAQQPDYVWAYLLYGYALSEQKLWEAAEESYARAKQLLEKHPNAEAEYALQNSRGLLRIRTNRLGQAEDELREAVAQMPERPAARINLARVYILRRRWAEAKTELEAAVARGWEPAVLADVYAQQAEALLGTRRHAAVAAACRLVGGSPMTPLTSSALSQPLLGTQLYGEGVVREASAACRKALELRPTHWRARGLLALALFERGDYEGSARAWGAYLQSGGPQDADIYRRLGHAHLLAGKYAEAADAFTRGLAFDPAAADLHLNRGWAFYFGHAYPFALRDFEAAVSAAPRAAEAYCGSGLCRVEGAAYRDGVRDAERALACRPTSARTVYNIACIYARAVDRLEGDAGAADRGPLAEQWRLQAVALLGRALDLLPDGERRGFWQRTVVPDTALASICRTAKFQELARAFGGAEGK